MELDRKVRETILGYQVNEITEHHIYRRLAGKVSDLGNRKVLERISEDELRHAGIWKQFTGTEARPNRLKVWKFCLISRLFGLSFGLKLMERGEKGAQVAYRALDLKAEEITRIAREEKEHEDEILGMLDEDFLKYTSSMVLGLNDALVELTGALAGFTLALRNSRLIALVGLVTGIAASLSMASSEYLSTKAEAGEKNPLKASVYTGIAYLVTVGLLIAPFLLLTSYFVSLAITLLSAVVIIFVFNFYVSVAKDLPLGRQFSEMAGLSLGIAGLSFFIGYLLRTFLKVDI